LNKFVEPNFGSDTAGHSELGNSSMFGVRCWMLDAFPNTFVAIPSALCQITFVSNKLMQMTSAKFYHFEPADTIGRK